MRHVCLPVRLFARMQKLSTHWEIFMKCDIGVSVEVSSRKFELLYNLTRITCTRHEPLRKFTVTSRSTLLRMRNVLEKIVEQSKTQFYVQLLSPENRALYQIMWKNMADRQVTNMNILRRMRIATN